MFFLLDKKKIYSYLVTVSIVVILFIFSAIYNDFNDTVQTANKVKLLPIYNVKMEDKKIALTMNCAWSQ